jgi:tetratricopeptide (TPR) repeat protein
LQEGEYKEAIEAFNHAIRSDSNHIDAYLGLASALSGLGKYNEALEAYKKAVNIQPDADAYYNMGNIYLKQGKHKMAIGEYKKTVMLSPKHAGAYKKMGDAHSNLKTYIHAVKAYKKALGIQPDFAAAYNAYVELTKSKYNETRDAYLEASRDSPLDVAPRVELAEFCLIAGGFNRALEMANELLANSEIRIDAEYRMVLTFIDISASFFIGERPEAIYKSGQIIKAYKELPGDYSGSWSYAVSKRFISRDRRLPTSQRQLLLQIIDILESPKSRGVEKFPHLRKAIAAAATR